MIMQRIAGLFCAVSMASVMARYMSWVMAFFFSGRRSVITRVASSSVTMMCPVMSGSPNSSPGAAASFAALSYIIRHAPKPIITIFDGSAVSLRGKRRCNSPESTT